MAKITVNIISYLGSPEVRDKRWEMQVKQLDWLLDIDFIESINVLAMEWTPEEIEKYKDVINIIEMDKMPQGNARNFLLAKFYNSNYDWGLFLDNDAVLYDHMSGADYFQELCEVPQEALKDVDVIIPIDPRQEPFTADYLRNKDSVDNNLIFKTFPGMKTSFFIIKNFPKSGKEEQYFDESFTILEDYEKAIDLYYHGYAVYKSKNMVLKEYGTNISTLPYEENGGRKKVNDKWREVIYNKWKDAGLKRDGDNIQALAFMKSCCKRNLRPLKISVPKSENAGLSAFL